MFIIIMKWREDKKKKKTIGDSVEFGGLWLPHTLNLKFQPKESITDGKKIQVKKSF